MRDRREFWIAKRVPEGGGRHEYVVMVPHDGRTWADNAEIVAAGSREACVAAKRLMEMQR